MSKITVTTIRVTHRENMYYQPVIIDILLGVNKNIEITDEQCCKGKVKNTDCSTTTFTLQKFWNTER